MSNDDDPTGNLQRTSRSTRVLELLRPGGTVLLKRGEALVGVDLVREVLEATATKAHELDKDDFFRRVAEHADAERLLDMAADVDDGLMQPHIARAVSEGFDNMRRCTHESAKNCLAVLVAQEVHDTSMSTEYFRASSHIIASTSIDVLATIRDMLEAWLIVSVHDGDFAPILCRVETGAGPLFFARTTTNDSHYVRLSAPSGMRQWYRFSELYLRTAEFRRALACLEAAGFGVTPEGTAQERGPQNLGHASRCFEWHTQRVGWAQQLMRCLDLLPREMTSIRRGLTFSD